MLPGTILYVYLGTAAKNLAQLASGKLGTAKSGQQVLFGIGLLATVAVTVYVTKIARQALREYVPKTEQDDDSAEAAAI